MTQLSLIDLISRIEATTLIVLLLLVRDPYCFQGNVSEEIILRESQSNGANTSVDDIDENDFLEVKGIQVHVSLVSTHRFSL